MFVHDGFLYLIVTKHMTKHMLNSSKFTYDMPVVKWCVRNHSLQRTMHSYVPLPLQGYRAFGADYLRT